MTGAAYVSGYVEHLRLGRGGAAGALLRLQLKRTHVAHRSEHKSRLCKVPLGSA
jgi:hypothetical protein